MRVLARDRRAADKRRGTLIAAVPSWLIDTAASRPWSDDTSSAQTPARGRHRSAAPCLESSQPLHLLARSRQFGLRPPWLYPDDSQIAGRSARHQTKSCCMACSTQAHFTDSRGAARTGRASNSLTHRRKAWAARQKEIAHSRWAMPLTSNQWHQHCGRVNRAWITSARSTAAQWTPEQLHLYLQWQGHSGVPQAGPHRAASPAVFGANDRRMAGIAAGGCTGSTAGA